VPAAIVGAVLVVAVFLVARSGGGGTRSVVDDLPSNDPSKSDFAVERQVQLTGGSGTRIGATLTLPPKEKTPVAGVLIVPGFGAIDKDAVMATTTPDGSADRLSQDLNYSRPGTPDNLLRDLNDVLVAAGAATLRYDKRGSGASQLQASQALSYDDLVADAKAGLDFLAQRREMASVPLAVVGDDQGGLIALRLAGDPRVKSVVLVSTFGRPLADVMGDDLVAARGDAGKEQSDQLHDVASRLAAGQPLPKPEDLNPNLRAVLRPNQEGYLRAVFSLDPVAEARTVRVATLLVRGAKDTTVTAVDSERLRGALPPSAEELVVPDGDHNLGVATRRDPVVMSQIASWLSRHVAG
jgi:pimeloyl-ACP methyl ester carboxylesterase